MNRRRRHVPPPPDDAENVVGPGYEFKPEDDRVNAGLPPLPVVEFLPPAPRVPSSDGPTGRTDESPTPG